jgi:hypothetical protein
MIDDHTDERPLAASTHAIAMANRRRQRIFAGRLHHQFLHGASRAPPGSGRSSRIRSIAIDDVVGVDVPAVMPTASVREPLGGDPSGLDTVDPGQRGGTPGELAGVVAVRAADHDDDIGLTCEVPCGILTVLGRPADGVDEADVGLGELPPDESDQVPHILDRLRRLGGDAYARMRVEHGDVVIVQDDVERASRSSVSPRTSTWLRWPMMTG